MLVTKGQAIRENNSSLSIGDLPPILDGVAFPLNDQSHNLGMLLDPMLLLDIPKLPQEAIVWPRVLLPCCNWGANYTLS